VSSRGELTALLLVSTGITVVGAFGLSWLARADVAERPALAKNWASVGLRAGLLFTPFALGAAGVVVYLLKLSVAESIATVVLFLFSGLSASRGVTANILISLGESSKFAFANLFMTLTVLTIILVGFVTGNLTLFVAIAANAAGFVVQSLMLGSGFRAVMSKPLSRSDPENDGSLAVPRLRALIPRAFRSWLSQISDLGASRSDVILLTSQAATTQLGLYSVVALIPQLTYTVYTTIIQQSYARNPRVPLARRTTILWMTCGFVGIGLAATSVPVAYVLIPVIFGPEYERARDYLLLAGAMTIGVALIAPVAADSALRRKPAPYLICSIAGIIAIVVALGHLVGVAVALPTLAGLLAVLSLFYILKLNNGNLGWLRPSEIIRLFRPLP
jgi:O-antigen/teichoic acid export membrane protein